MVSIDGTEISGATIDGIDVVEITVDGNVVWVASTSPVYYSFEDMSPWTTYNGGQNTGRVYDGSYSYYSNANNTNIQAQATPFPNGNKINRFSYVYQETQNSTGNGVRLVNSNGNYEGGTATDNPQWCVDFASTTGRQSGGGNYDEWVTVIWDFDWPNSQVTVSRGGSDPHTGTYNLKQGVDISKVELWNFSGDIWGDNDLDAWWDKLEFITDSVIIEGFESNSFSSDWTTNNFHIKGKSKSGNYSAGSRSNGEINAVWNPLDSPTEISSFEYSWWETSNQTGQVVILEDKNGNEIMESGNENPQWYLNDGSGSRYEVYGGDGYQRWINFSFEFDWDNGQYSYTLKDTSTGTTRTGTENMDNNNPVDRIRFTGTGYGSADDVVFDDLKIVL